MPAVADERTTLRVSDVMTTPVHTLRLDDTITSAMALFERYRFHHAVIVEKREVVGVLSDRDILKTVSPFVGVDAMERAQDTHTLQKRVHQIVSRRVISVAPDETVANAAHLMRAQRVSCLPVIDPSGGLVGIVTPRDLLRWFSQGRTAAAAKG